MSTGKLKIGVDLSGRNLYVNITSALTIPTATTIVARSSGGYTIVEYPMNGGYFAVADPNGSTMYTYYRPTYVLPYTTTIVLPSDFGFLTEVDITTPSYGVLTRDAHIKVYVLSEDGDKVVVNNEYHVGDSTGSNSLRVDGYITGNKANVYATIPLTKTIGDDVTGIAIANLVSGSNGVGIRIRQNGKYILGTANAYVNLYDYTRAGNFTGTLSITPFGVNGVFIFPNTLSDATNNDALAIEFTNFGLSFT